MKMQTFNFEKQGIEFFFRNPQWSNNYNNLVMEYKVIGIKENKKNDGYYYNSRFYPNKNAMELNDVKINGQEVNGVCLPEDILKEIAILYQQLKEEDYQRKLNNDIKYTMNDDTTYGIYNGISRLDIEVIVYDIKKQNNSNVSLYTDDITRMLNNDEELKQIAEETYSPDQEGNWNEEYLTWFRKAVKEKKAPGYGTIPNKIIKAKITDIILKEIEKENREKQDEENRINNLFELAKQIGERQLINKWSEPCNDPKEECNLDICYLWIMPDGSKKQTRSHTW
jgi:hypothetical protein